ncbi:MAG: hypothetical protein COB85_08360 [Bacteroidetes bacterium]|nr:MAG: hypothetical protein COB85_08360 [Bacteroidota bacterium]
MKKFLIATVAGTVTMLVLAGLFHGILVGDLLKQLMSEFPNSQQPPPMLAIGMAVLISGIMAHMYPKGYEGGSPFTEGFKFGAPIGLIMVLPLNLVLVGALGADSTFSMLDIPWHLIEQGVTGGVIGLVYSKVS